LPNTGGGSPVGQRRSNAWRDYGNADVWPCRHALACESRLNASVQARTVRFCSGRRTGLLGAQPARC
jgi:hypothetical protein